MLPLKIGTSTILLVLFYFSLPYIDGCHLGNEDDCPRNYRSKETSEDFVTLKGSLSRGNLDNNNNILNRYNIKTLVSERLPPKSRARIVERRISQRNRQEINRIDSNHRTRSSEDRVSSLGGERNHEDRNFNGRINSGLALNRLLDSRNLMRSSIDRNVNILTRRQSSDDFIERHIPSSRRYLSRERITVEGQNDRSLRYEEHPYIRNSRIVSTRTSNISSRASRTEQANTRNSIIENRNSQRNTESSSNSENAYREDLRRMSGSVRSIPSVETQKGVERHAHRSVDQQASSPQTRREKLVDASDRRQGSIEFQRRSVNPQTRRLGLQQLPKENKRKSRLERKKSNFETDIREERLRYQREDEMSRRIDSRHQDSSRSSNAMKQQESSRREHLENRRYSRDHQDRARYLERTEEKRFSNNERHEEGETRRRLESSSHRNNHIRSLDRIETNLYSRRGYVDASDRKDRSRTVTRPNTRLSLGARQESNDRRQNRDPLSRQTDVRSAERQEEFRFDEGRQTKESGRNLDATRELLQVTRRMGTHGMDVNRSARRYVRTYNEGRVENLSDEEHEDMYRIGGKRTRSVRNARVTFSKRSFSWENHKMTDQRILDSLVDGPAKNNFEFVNIAKMLLLAVSVAQILSSVNSKKFGFSRIASLIPAQKQKVF